ncbi:MAG: prepilin peptidase [Solobacterium sp.]|nr:prepilin peptidase [Solobacterium sp.]
MLYVFSMILGILSVRYPSYRSCSAYELMTGMLFVLALFLLGCHVKQAFLVPVCLFSAIADLRTGEIPDLCSVLILGYAVYCRIFDPGCLIIIFVTTLLSINHMLGFGDAKLLTAWSVLFGLSTCQAVSIASFAALPFALFNRKTRQIVFAPFLCIGFLFCLISE